MKKKSWTRFSHEDNKIKSLFFLIAAVLFSTSPGAAIITVDYSGVLDRVDDSLTAHFSAGDVFTGSVVYSTTGYNGMMTDDPYADLSRANGFHDVITEFTIDIGDFHFSISNVGFVEIYNEGTLLVPPYVDDRVYFSLGTYVSPAQYDISPALWNFIDQTAGPLTDSLHMDLIDIMLSDLTNTLFNDESLPLIFPELDAFSETSMSAWFYENDGGFGLGPPVGNIFGTLTSMKVSQVPVPAASWLFGSGLVGLIGIARRKKS